MLNYKKILFGPSTENLNQNTDQERTNYVQRIDDLKKQIKELKDNDKNNDKIEDVFDKTIPNSLELQLSIALSLPANKKALNDMVNTLDDIITKKGNSLGGVKQSADNLLSLLKKQQTNNIYNEFSGMITADKLQNLNSLKDKEIDNLVKGIQDGIITDTQALGLYNKMTKISIGDVNNFKSTDKEYFNKVKDALSKKLGLEPNSINNVENRLKESELKDIFGDGNYVGNLNSITRLYTSINDWDGSNIEANKLKPDFIKGKQFAAEDFANKFNEVNKKRIGEVDSKVRDLIEKASIEGITVDNVGKFVKGEIEISIEAILGITDKSIIGAQDADRLDLNILNIAELSKDHFKDQRNKWGEALKKRIEDANNARVAAEQAAAAGERSIDDAEKASNFSNMKIRIDAINNILQSNEQFLKINEDDKSYSYNFNKAKDYLQTLTDKDWNGYFKNLKKDSGERYAWISAIQIALNKINGNDKIKVDGLLGPETAEKVKIFQEKNKVEGKPDGYQPGKRTITALLAKLGKTSTQIQNGEGGIEQGNNGFSDIDSILNASEPSYEAYNYTTQQIEAHYRYKRGRIIEKIESKVDAIKQNENINKNQIIESIRSDLVTLPKKDRQEILEGIDKVIKKFNTIREYLKFPGKYPTPKDLLCAMRGIDNPEIKKLISDSIKVKQTGLSIVFTVDEESYNPIRNRNAAHTEFSDRSGGFSQVETPVKELRGTLVVVKDTDNGKPIDTSITEKHEGQHNWNTYFMPDKAEVRNRPPITRAKDEITAYLRGGRGRNIAETIVMMRNNLTKDNSIYKYGLEGDAREKHKQNVNQLIKYASDLIYNKEKIGLTLENIISMLSDTPHDKRNELHDNIMQAVNQGKSLEDYWRAGLETQQAEIEKINNASSIDEIKKILNDPRYSHISRVPNSKGGIEVSAIIDEVVKGNLDISYIPNEIRQQVQKIINQ